PASYAASNVATDSSSSTGPHSPPNCHAPKEISLISQSVRPNRRYFTDIAKPPSSPSHGWFQATDLRAPGGCTAESQHGQFADAGQASITIWFLWSLNLTRR